MGSHRGRGCGLSGSFGRSSSLSGALTINGQAAARSVSLGLSACGAAALLAPQTVPWSCLVRHYRSAERSILGLALAWRWEALGGAVCLGFFAVHLALFWAIRGRFFPLPALLTFSPLPIAGVLFLACGWKSRTAQAKPP